MMLQSQEYDFAMFNKLPHINAVGRLDLDDAVHQLGQLICDLGMQDDLALHRIHKHFDVSQEEQVLMTVDDSYVWVKAVPAPRASTSLPYMFGLKEASWAPLQYAAADFPGLADALLRIQARPVQVIQITARIIELGMQDKLGLCINYLHALPKSYLGRLEETDELNRIQVFRGLITDSNEDYVNTFWSFDCRCGQAHQQGCSGFCACCAKCYMNTSGQHVGG